MAGVIGVVSTLPTGCCWRVTAPWQPTRRQSGDGVSVDDQGRSRRMEDQHVRDHRESDHQGGDDQDGDQTEDAPQLAQGVHQVDDVVALSRGDR